MLLQDQALNAEVSLYPYQTEGALFAARVGRAILADEMGLGKTMQAIAAAELLARHFGAERVLVVCPTSLKHQWQREIARAAGYQRSCEAQVRPRQPTRGDRPQSGSFGETVVHRRGR